MRRYSYLFGLVLLAYTVPACADRYTLNASAKGHATSITGAMTLPDPPAPPPLPIAGSANAGVPQGMAATPVCTTALIGPHRTYNVHTDGDMQAAPFGTLVAGDVVNIYAKANQATYKFKFGLRAQGTATAPVIINGVTDAECNRPIIDFNGARTTKGSATVFTSVQYGERLGGIVIMRNNHTDAYRAYEPQFIVIQGLQLQNAPNGATYTTMAGGTDAYADAACLWIQHGTDFTIRNNVMTRCAFGIFTMAKDDSLTETVRRIDIANNRIYLNGAFGSFYDHDIYVQSDSPVIEGNYLGPVIAGSEGMPLKDRSARAIVRQNTIDCTVGSGCMYLVESNDQASGIPTLPYYGTDYVYNNTIVSGGNEAILYGGGNFGYQNRDGVTTTVFVPPQGVNPYRKHLRFWNNSYALKSRDWADKIFFLAAQETQVDAWNNTFDLTGFTGGNAVSWLYWAGTLRLGPGNVVKGTTPIPAWNDGREAATPGIYTLITGAMIPSDPLLQTLH